MGHRYSSSATQTSSDHLDRRLSDTRIRPPHTGLVQVCFWKIGPHGVRNSEAFSQACSRECLRNTQSRSRSSTAFRPVLITSSRRESKWKPGREVKPDELVALLHCFPRIFRT